jgi:Tol biopolymer transport system component
VIREQNSFASRRCVLGLGAVVACAVVLGLVPTADAAFPGPNGQIAFLNYPGWIYSISPSGGDKAKLAKGIDPAFSPDGKVIAFSEHGIRVMHSDGSHVRKITPKGHGPAFSPTGHRIAFWRFRGINAEICTIRRNGTDRKTLVPAPRTGNPRQSVQNFDPVYSPNGHRIVFWRVTNTVQLYSVRPNGTHLKPLPGTNGGRWPDFSPDGRRIVFTRGDGRREEVYSFDLASQRVRQLTHNHSVDDGPVYSPDGRHILIDRDFRKLVSIRRNGSHPQVIGHTYPHTGAEPSWGVHP